MFLNEKSRFLKAFGLGAFALATTLSLTPPAFGHVGPYASLGGDLLYGTSASEDSSSVQSRALLAYGLEGVLAARWHEVVLGMGADYSFWKQWTDPSNVGNSNTQGKMFSYGPVVGLSFEHFELLGRYNFHSTYNFDQNNSAGRSVVYSSPTSYEAEARFKRSKHTYWGVKYTHTQYKQISVNGAEASDLSNGARLNFNAVGLVIGMEY